MITFFSSLVRNTICRIAQGFTGILSFTLKSSDSSQNTLFVKRFNPPQIGGSIDIEETIIKALRDTQNIIVLTGGEAHQYDDTLGPNVTTIRRKYIIDENVIPNKWERWFKKSLAIVIFPIDLHFLIRQHHIHKILYTGFDVLGWGTALTALLYNVRCIGIFYGEELTGKKIRSNLLYTLGFTKHFVTASQYTKKNLLKLLKNAQSKKIEIIYPSYNDSVFTPNISRELAREKLNIPSHYKMILTVARDEERKGQKTVIQILPFLLKEFPDLHYYMVGARIDKKKFTDFSKNLHVENHVHIISDAPFNDLPLYYRACDFFVMPNKDVPYGQEGFGIVFLEAGGCERAVIGGKSGGVPEAIEHEKSGLLVNSDSLEDVTQAISLLLRNPETADNMGRYGYKKAMKNFSRQAIMKEMQRIF